MARLGTLLLKGAGALLVAFIVLSVIATLVGIVLSIVATVVTAVVTLAILALVVLGIAGLVSMFWGDDDADLESAYTGSTADTATASVDDPADELRSQYVSGRLDDDEFERELDRLLEPDEFDRSDDLERDRL